MFTRTRSKKYLKQEAINWLIWLSRKTMQSTQTVFLIEQMKPEWIEADNQKWPYRIFIWLSSSLLVSIIFFVSFGIEGLSYIRNLQGYQLRDQLLLYLTCVLS